ncbi:MAG TPA: methyltransferase domain-containing protein [Acetobacteraceae bacterium]|nr:methyltransferase domain-containing protein [Acetobacteraceae bacterium]
MAAISNFARFPSTSFISQAEFAQFRRATQEHLDARYGHETALVTRDEVLVLPGTCAPCLRPTRFRCDTRHWERRADGRTLPAWDEALVCDCADALGKRARAVVHFAQSLAALRGWTRLLLFGPPDPSHRRLTALAGEVLALPSLVADGGAFRIDAADGSCHLAIAVECLHRVPPLDAALAEFRRVLVPGGSLVFTVPFRHNALHTISRADLAGPDSRPPAMTREAAHEIGWDLLDRLRDAGFADARLHCYWSAELGYLGPFSMIVHATL